jgi:hypothetical protein
MFLLALISNLNYFLSNKMIEKITFDSKNSNSLKARKDNKTKLDLIIEVFI